MTGHFNSSIIPHYHFFDLCCLCDCRDNREDIAEVNEQESRNNFTSNLQNDIQSARYVLNE